MMKLTEIFVDFSTMPKSVYPLYPNLANASSPTLSGTGFAVVLRYILHCHGLSFERDYNFKSVGSTRLRLAELSSGKIAGAMVNPRYVEDNGVANLRLLALGKDYADPYPARLSLTTRAWAE